MTYQIGIEHLPDTYAEFEPLYRQHYAEMRERLAKDGVEYPPYRPRLDIYFETAERGDLLHYTVRVDGKPVGYSNIYLTADMHNHDLIAQEDTIYILPEHRNGTGKVLSKFILADLERRGIKRITVSAMTDLRVEKLWRRMGFKPVATQMIYEFGGNANVRT